MKLVSTKSFKQALNCDPYVSAVLRYNNIDLSKIPEVFPDKHRTYEPSQYLFMMEPIDKGDEFVDYIENFPDERYCIIGDYDCDGIMATVIMAQALSLCGRNCSFIIPDRFTDGYGMKKQHIDCALENGATTVITVDNGIVADEAIDYAHEKGLKVIITDHHKPKGHNNGDLVIDPLYNNDKFKGISGATVALKLTYKLSQRFDFDKKILDDLVALAGITAISDVMPMINENRILVKTALNYLNNEVYKLSFTHRLADLLNFYLFYSEDPEQLKFKNFNKTSVEFYLVPVVNAVNRVKGNVNELVSDILEIFYKESSAPLNKYAEINQERRAMTRELQKECKFTDDAVQVQLLSYKSLQNMSGIAGLVASYVVENQNKPAIIGVDNFNVDGMEKFSGRSIPGFSLFNAVQSVSDKHPDLDITFGGHDAALGCAIRKDQIDDFRKYISEEFKLSHETVEEIYFMPEDIKKYIAVFERLAPYGTGFEFPKFYVKDKIKFVKEEYRTFKLESMPDIFIKCYDKSNLIYIARLFQMNPNAEIEAYFSLCYDNSFGKVMVKLDKINREIDYVNKLVDKEMEFSER